MGGAIQGHALVLSDVVTAFAGSSSSAKFSNGTGTSALFYRESGITSDGTSLYVADSGNHMIRKIVIATGLVTTLAGQAGTYGFEDGIGTKARFTGPHGIVTDGTNVFVADTFNQTIRKIVITTGVVTTIAGIPGVLRVRLRLLTLLPPQSFID